MSRRAMMAQGGGGGGGFVTTAWAWWKAGTGQYKDAGVTLAGNGDLVEQWNDATGHGRHLTQGAGDAPTLSTGTTFNGIQTVRFPGPSTAKFLKVPDTTGFTAGEIFISLKVDNDPNADFAHAGLLNINSQTSGLHGAAYPYSDSNVYTQFGTTADKAGFNPTPALTSFRVLNVWSATNDYAALLDNVSQMTSGTNTVAFSTAGFGYLGRSHAYDGTNADGFMQGNICEVILYDRKLSGGDRTQTYNYISSGTGAPA